MRFLLNCYLLSIFNVKITNYIIVSEIILTHDMMKVLPKKPIVQQARWEKELAQVRCRCGPRRQVAIIRSPSLLYIICLLHDLYPKRIIITQGVFYMVTIFVIFYMLHGHYPKRIIIAQGVFYLFLKVISVFCG